MKPKVFICETCGQECRESDKGTSKECLKCWSKKQLEYWDKQIQETNELAEKFITALNNKTFEGIPIKKTDGIPGATGKHKQTAVVHAVSSSAHADQFDELTAKGWKLDMVLGLYYKP